MSVPELTRLGEPFLVVGGVVAVAAASGLLAHFLIFRAMRRVSGVTETVFDEAFVARCSRPSRLLLPLLAINLALPWVEVPQGARRLVVDLFAVLLILGFGWFLVAFTGVLQRVFLERFDLGVRDNLRARKVHTQVDIVRKILVVVIGLLTVAVILLRFEELRRLGTGILASAGVAGLVIGFSAQRMLGNLLAGFQIAVTQPIRIDDVVIVEGEWGWIEEITLTYVVVRVWDKRRIVLPISYFIEKPFQNWTRTSAEILGTVYLYVDYTVDVGEIRRELERILAESEHWDGEVWRLHVTEATDRCVELRALMSAADSPTAWELRCEVRERLLDFLQERYPDKLPRYRAELDRGLAGDSEEPPTGSGAEPGVDGP